MAASELINDDDTAHLEISEEMETPPPPSRVANGNPARPSTSAATATSDPAPDDRGGGRGDQKTRGVGKHGLIRSLHQGLRRQRDYVKITLPEGRANPLPSEWWRTGVAFVYALFNLFMTTVIITFIHERVPDKSVSPPLPDKFFDYLDRVPWAFTVTEVNGLLLCAFWFIQWLFLKHKSIIARRCFFLIGTLYMYRCVTMYVTTLPVPGRHMVCAPKLYNDSTGKVWRILRLISGGGLSITTGPHLMCGDFLYSGHTVMLTLSYLFIKEYSPRHMWYYHWLCWLLSVSGVVCILLGHEHYSIDVVIGYFVTSRIFWWYHTMANTHALREDPHNYLSKTWWNCVFHFLERNVQGVVPVVFCWPVSLPPSCTRTPCEHYSMVQREGPQ
ncbi:phosphatidylcholine:ceramide cholinephosphotransferase 2-like [Aplochiton taeniatus]